MFCAKRFMANYALFSMILTSKTTAIFAKKHMIRKVSLV